MAVHKGTIEAISHKFDKFAVLIEDKWYNTKKEYAEEWPVKPTVGDVITFDDGGKKYLGKMKIVSSGGGTAAPKSGGGGGYSSLGVEVGHASNLAMRMMEQRLAYGGRDLDVGGKEYYTEFVEYTETIYKIMKGLKDKLGSPEVKKSPTMAVEPTEPPKPEPVVPEADLDDLF